MICNQENNSKTNCILNQSKYLYCENIIKSSNDVPLERPINVCYIGAGYVGGTSGAVMAYKCPEDRVKVTICDTCETKINSWNSDKVFIYNILTIIIMFNIYQLLLLYNFFRFSSCHLIIKD